MQLLRHARYWFYGFAALLSWSTLAHAETTSIRSSRLELPVQEIRQTHPPYASFCERFPDHCDLSGPTEIEYTEAVARNLLLVNTSANRSISCEMSDRELFGFEEFWTYPIEGLGDCEDIAIFKREELVKRGLPRGAMTIAIVHHRKEMHAHAVLLVETTVGTLLLNSVSNEVLLWHKAPYNFEAREKPNGTWERFDQSIWTFD